MLLKKTIKSPHYDIELKYQRQPIDYFLTFPSTGMTEQTGLIVVVGGCPWRADDDYLLKTLHPYLAENYNCIVAGINFFGIARTSEVIKTQFTFDDKCLANLEAIYGIERKSIVFENGTIDLEKLSQIMQYRRIRQIDPRCKLTALVDGASYQSFGLLPAIDNLAMTGDLLKNYPINKKRLVAFGTSYGGYITNLMGKYAPQTFSAIIDNSGFTRPFMMYLTGMDLLKDTEYLMKIPPFGHEILGATPSPWVRDNELSPYYLSDACKFIRSLLVEHHFMPTKTKHYIFHSLSDAMVPISEKEKFAALLKKDTSVKFWKIGPDDIDGKIFKTIDHALGASLRGIFDMVSQSDDQALDTNTDETDFDQQNRYSFFCGMKTYTFKYLKDHTVSVSIADNTSI